MYSRFSWHYYISDVDNWSYVHWLHEHDINPQTNVHYGSLKPLGNSFIQQVLKTKWDVLVYQRYIYLVKPALGPPKNLLYVSKAEDAVITRLRIGHKGTSSLWD